LLPPRHSVQLLILLSDLKLVDNSAVTLDIGLHQIVEQVSSVTDHLLKSATAVVVVLVGLEVLGKVLDAVGQQSYLNLGGTCVTLVGGILVNNCLFFFSGHFLFHLSFITLTQATVGEVPQAALSETRANVIQRTLYHNTFYL